MISYAQRRLGQGGALVENLSLFLMVARNFYIVSSYDIYIYIYIYIHV